MKPNTRDFRCMPLHLLHSALIALLCLNLCGCLSTAVVETARTRRFVDENGEVVKIKKGRTELYWWLPLTIPVDAVTLVFWVALESLGTDHDYNTSSKEPKKLHLSQ
jgi:hypothetical protein